MSPSERVKFIALMLAFALLFLAFALFGCNGAAGTQSATAATPMVAGTYYPWPQQFDFRVYNNTQWPLVVGNAPGQLASGSGLLIPPGSFGDFWYPYLPGSIFVEAQTTGTPIYYFPSQQLTLGVNYGPNDMTASAGFP